MIQAIILIVLAIVIAPILFPLLMGTTGILFTIYKEGFSDPEIQLIILVVLGLCLLPTIFSSRKKRKKLDDLSRV